MKRTLLASVVCACFLFVKQGLLADDLKTVEIGTVEKEGKTYLYAKNPDLYFPQQVILEIDPIENLKFSISLPVSQVVLPYKSLWLGSLAQVDPTKGSNYQYKASFWPGDPRTAPDPDAAYLWPCEHGAKHHVNQGYFGKETHQSCYCLDFDFAEGTPICAARGGTVVVVKQDSNVGGIGQAFAKYDNYVRILHGDGTWADYAHVQKNGARVNLGDKVTAGQIIALSGHTGEASGPHLHFQVNKPDWGTTGTTIPTKFLNQKGELLSPKEGKYYYSYHPGKPAFKEVSADSVKEADLEKHRGKAAYNNTVKIRTEQIDDKTIFYCANGTKKKRVVTLNFPTLNNLKSSKPLPFTKSVPAGKEVYFLSLDIVVPGQPTSNTYECNWK
jgi:murein DD-endopeptidase MepM/ murein hydrolase activator NlpD